MVKCVGDVRVGVIMCVCGVFQQSSCIPFDFLLPGPHLGALGALLSSVDGSAQAHTNTWSTAHNTANCTHGAKHWAKGRLDCCPFQCSVIVIITSQRRGNSFDSSDAKIQINFNAENSAMQRPQQTCIICPQLFAQLLLMIACGCDT